MLLLHDAEECDHSYHPTEEEKQACNVKECVAAMASNGKISLVFTKNLSVEWLVPCNSRLLHVQPSNARLQDNLKIQLDVEQ